MAFARRVFLVAVCAASAAAVYFTGDSFQEDFVCEVNGRLRGVCVEQCSAAGGKGAESCGVAGRDLRCCPGPDAAASDEEVRGLPSRQKCKEYGESIQPNSCPDFRPFNGSNKAVLGEYPYSVSIGYLKKGGETVYACGGALISDRYVLTTAVCVKGSPQTGTPAVVRVGDLNLKSEDDDGDHVQEVEVSAATFHPNYEGKMVDDVGLLRLASPVAFSAAVRPACLFPERRPPTSTLVVAGYGKDQGGKSGVLLKADLELYKDNCTALYGKFKLVIDDERMICAGGSGKDTCTGDSGVALAVKLASQYCNYAIVGLASFGPNRCGNTPGVYTRLYPYLPWIESIVWSS